MRKSRIIQALAVLVSRHPDFVIEKRKKKPFGFVEDPNGGIPLLKLAGIDISDMVSLGFLRETRRSDDGKAIYYGPTKYLHDFHKMTFAKRGAV